MNLRELKKMVAEEYNAYLHEQATATPAAPAAPAAARPTPATPAQPGISVSPDDIQVDDDGGNAEEILNSIYNMLKGHFEAPDNAGADDDMDDMDMDDDMGDEDIGDIEDDEDDIEENKNSVGPNAGYKAINESVARFQKLANIKK